MGLGEERHVLQKHLAPRDDQRRCNDSIASVRPFNRDLQRPLTILAYFRTSLYTKNLSVHLSSFSSHLVTVCFLSTATMSEKPSHERVSREMDESPVRKASISNSISSRARKNKAEEIARIEKLATAPGVTLESFAHLDEKKILRKMDWHLIPMLALLYLLSFLDRGNIGNAKIEGLVETLGMSGAQYNWCLTVFFFTYVP